MFELQLQRQARCSSAEELSGKTDEAAETYIVLGFHKTNCKVLGRRFLPRNIIKVDIGIGG